MKFNTATILATFALASSVVALPAWGEPGDDKPVGPFAIKITGSANYEGKYVVLTEVKPQLMIATVSSTGPKARFISGYGSIKGTNGVEVPSGQHKTVYSTAFASSRLIGQHAQPLYFVVVDLFSKGAPKSSVEGITLEDNFEVNSGKVEHGGSTEGFYVCPGTKAIGGGEKTYDAVMLSMGPNPFVPSCEKVTLNLEQLRD